MLILECSELVVTSGIAREAFSYVLPRMRHHFLTLYKYVELEATQEVGMASILNLVKESKEVRVIGTHFLCENNQGNQKHLLGKHELCFQ